MPAPPPPPPPPPMPGAAGGPPPPPPPPPANLPARPDAKAAKGRGALLGDIQSGARLKKVTQVNDRSAPIIDKSKDSGGPPVGGAPPIPGGLRPPAPPGGNRARSNSDQVSRDGGSTGMESAPQLGGLFAGGMPKLRKSAGGVNMYDSDPETNSRKSPSVKAAPAVRNGGPPPRPGGAPPPLPPSAAPVPPSIAALKSSLRPASTHSLPDLASSKPKPPPPIGKKPPIPPPALRKPSGLTAASMTSLHAPSAPPPRPSSSPAPNSAPPPPPLPQSVLRPPPAPVARFAPSPPAAQAPPPPPAPQSRIIQVQDEDDYDPYRYDSSNSRETPPAPAPPPPPPPQTNGHKEPSLAAQAARNAFGQHRNASPAAPPPLPPPGAHLNRSTTSPSSSNGPPAAPPPPPTSRSNSHPPPPPPPPAPKASTPGGIPTAGGLSVGGVAPSSLGMMNSMADVASYTLTNGRNRADSAPQSMGNGGGGARFVVQDARWKFQGDDQLPKARDFTGGPKRYRAGRGSTVPLDVKAFE